MEAPGSVTGWIVQLQQGDPAAAQKLWERYFPQLVALARNRLKGAPCRAADEEDVALSAFQSFCAAVERGLFPQLADRDGLWPLLITLTARKAFELRKHQRRLKRGGGKVLDEAALTHGQEQEQGFGLDQMIGMEPTPDFALQVAEECQRLLGQLNDAELQTIAFRKMEGWTNAEIAAQLGCVERTIERRLRVVRSLWAHEGQP